MKIFLNEIGLKTNQWGLVSKGNNWETIIENVYLCGDNRTGASTIIKCIVEGRRTADAITLKEDAARTRTDGLPFTDPLKRKVEIQNSMNPGWLIQGEKLLPRFQGEDSELPLKNGLIDDDPAEDYGRKRFYMLFEKLLKDRPHLFGKVESMI